MAGWVWSTADTANCVFSCLFSECVTCWAVPLRSPPSRLPQGEFLKFSAVYAARRWASFAFTGSAITLSRSLSEMRFKTSFVVS